MTFYSWLSKQSARVDRVGMISKLILTDNFTIDIKDNLESWQSYISRKQNRQDLTEVFQDAWSEYQN